jgi:hypothetical protein
MTYDVYIASFGAKYIPSVMKIGIDVQAVLRFCLRNLRGCNIAITGGRDL